MNLRFPLILTVVAVLAAVAAGERGAGVSSSPDMASCPALRSGVHDPVGDRNCVAELQLALRGNGYPGQRVTGKFLDMTTANVKDFQRRHGIRPVNGIVGPVTRAALLAGLPSTGRSGPPVVTELDYSRRIDCAVEALTCSFYLHRSTTTRFAAWIDGHPDAASLASGALVTAACMVQPVRFARSVCQVLGAGRADYIRGRLREAAQQHACLRLSLGLPDGSSGPHLLTAGPDRSANCVD